ncbi:MAG: hypothetical protein LWY06_12345, partial [Firmicutes bacterium]|nr:hypothetical protein [Bacillota bacterium]
LIEHKSWISSISIAADGQRAISGSWDNTVKVWDIETGECLKTLTEHKNWVNSVSLNYSGSMAISSSDDHSMQIWDIEKNKCIYINDEFYESPKPLFFGNKCSLILIKSAQTIYIEDLQSRNRQALFTCDCLVNCIAYSILEQSYPIIIAGDKAGNIHFLRIHGLDRIRL